MAPQIKRAKLLLPFILAIVLLPHNGASHELETSNTYRIASGHCTGTPYPDLCVSTLAAIPDLHAKTLPQIICAAINRTADKVELSADKCASYLRGQTEPYERRQRIALADCLDLFDQTMSDFHRAFSDLDKHPTSRLSDVQTVLSAAITNQFSCLDGFAYVDPSFSLRPLFQSRLLNISRLVSNSLSLSKKIHPGKRKNEVFEEYGRVVDGFPKWVSAGDRQLLKDNVSVADLVVAKDGTGDFTTVMAAVNATKDHGTNRTVIYIKAGAYLENVEVIKKKTNLMFVGDGIGKTVIKASRNVVDNFTTYRSATVAIVGNGFLARDLTIENAAGPSKHQAVALRNNADFSAFHRCSFVGYQDTLYTHSLRQFYRECDIYGTVDFIFGNAAVVFQNCNMYARRPDEKQKNIFTAQGREDPNQNTGISIQNCKLAAAADLAPVQAQFKTYLGRPWKQYSRTVVMQSYLDGLIDSAGWLEWNGSFALDTLYYGEYMNRGPGANTTARVAWPGYRVINSSVEAGRFTVGPFIDGGEWLGLTTIPFKSGLA